MLGIRVVIAQSYERIHRSNLVGMGILPLQFKAGESAETLGLSGAEVVDVHIPADLKPGQDISVTTDTGKSFSAIVRLDTAVELTYYHYGGILNFMLLKLLKGSH
jgi:aconitate hydratase